MTYGGNATLNFTLPDKIFDLDTPYIDYRDLDDGATPPSYDVIYTLPDSVTGSFYG